MAHGRIAWRSVPGTPDLALRFGERVRALRTARGMSRAELASQVGIESNAMARIERGQRFNAANLAPLATALGVEVRDLFDFGNGTEHRLRSIMALLRPRTSVQLDLAERVLRAMFQS